MLKFGHESQKNQNGFSAVETVLVIVIIILLAVVGYLVWHNHHKQSAVTKTTTTTASKATTKPTQTATPTSTQRYLTITEWNVKGTYDPIDNERIFYTINDSGGTPAIYTASFDVNGIGYVDSCVVAGGIIERAYADTVLDKAGTKAGDAGSPYTTKKIGDFYYVYIPNQSQCSNDVALHQQVEDTIKSLDLSLQAY